jgi:hypothetical protein
VVTVGISEKLLCCTNSLGGTNDYFQRPLPLDSSPNVHEFYTSVYRLLALNWKFRSIDY